MSDDQRDYRATLSLLRPALERVVKDPDFRRRLEEEPLVALRSVGIELDAALQAQLAGKRFSEFWEAQRAAAEGPVGTRDLPPDESALADEQLEAVAGGLSAFAGRGPPPNFAPPYVPVGPVIGTEEVLPTVQIPNVTIDPLKRG
jgi:hypothetical protein